MKRFAIALAIFLAVGAAASAEEPPCAIGGTNFLAQDKGDPKGDVTINCTGLTEAFGNQLTEVLNHILQDRLDPQMVIAKLSEIERIPEAGVARTLTEDQRHLILQSLNGKPASQIAITAHPAVEDSADYARALATPLLMVGWKIEGNEIRRVAVKALEPVTGVALVVRDKSAPPEKAVELRKALAAAKVTATLVSDPGMAADGTLLWVGRRPEFMPDQPK